MSYNKGMTLEFSPRAFSPVQPPNGVTKAKGAGKDAGKKTKTPKVDKNDLSWSLSNVNDTIDKSHKFLVMNRHSAAQPEESIYEPKRQATVEKSHLEASPGGHEGCSFFCPIAAHRPVSGLALQADGCNLAGRKGSYRIQAKCCSKDHEGGRS